MHTRRYKGAGIALFQKRNDVYAILLGKRTISPQKKEIGKFLKNSAKKTINELY